MLKGKRFNQSATVLLSTALYQRRSQKKFDAFTEYGYISYSLGFFTVKNSFGGLNP